MTTNTNKMTIDAYEDHLQEYIAATPQQVDGFMKIWVDSLLEKNKPDSLIFEVGSAFGRDAEYIESKGFKVERSDATLAFVEYLQARGHNARHFNLLVDTFDAKYDMVYAAAVLLHFTREETRNAVEKVFNNLLPEGIFAFSLKIGHGEEITNQKVGADRFFCYWEADEIDDLLHDVGFKSIDIKEAVDQRPDKPSWLLTTAVKNGRD